jgi:hypothetical protein
VPDPIDIDSFMLADAAKVFDGKLYIHGGGWNYLDIFEPESPRPVSLAGRVLIPWSEEARDITLEIHLERREGNQVLERAPILQIQMKSGQANAAARAAETATPFAFDIPGIVFLDAGQYAFVISHDGEELARTRFQVNFLPPTPRAQLPAST